MPEVRTGRRTVAVTAMAAAMVVACGATERAPPKVHEQGLPTPPPLASATAEGAEAALPLPLCCRIGREPISGPILEVCELVEHWEDLKGRCVRVRGRVEGRDAYWVYLSDAGGQPCRRSSETSSFLYFLRWRFDDCCPLGDFETIDALLVPPSTQAAMQCHNCSAVMLDDVVLLRGVEAHPR